MAYVGLNPQTQLLNTSTETFSGNSVAYQFNLSRAVASASDLDVMIGTTLQRPNTDYEAENTVLMFQTPPASGTNNITVTYRAGALNSLNLTANAFGAGTVGSPSVYSVAANNTGLYWGNATTMIVTNGGSNHTFFNGNTTSTGVGTGAIVVNGGMSVDGNLHAAGELHSLAETPSTGVSSGALLVNGGAGIAGNLNVGQNITCVGDFTVNGTFTTTGTDSLDVTDPFIFLANANPGDTYDTGVVSQFFDGTANRYTGYFRDITDNKYKLFGNLTVKPSTTVDTSDPSFKYQDLVLANLSATGNVNGTYFLGNGALLTGIITSVSNVTNGTSGVYVPALNGNVIVNVGGATIATVSSSVGLAVTGNVNATTGLSAAGNIVGGNITTAGIASATGNITSAANVAGGNILTGGLFSAAGNITGANVNTGGIVSAVGNLVTGANVVATGYVTAGGNVTGGNVKTAGIVSASGDVYGDNFTAGGAISAGTSVGATTDVNAGGDVNATNAITAGTTISATGNVTGGNVLTGGLVSATGNVTGTYILGNVAFATGAALSHSHTNVVNGSSTVIIPASAGNILANVTGNTIQTWANTGVYITGVASVSGNITGGNLNAVGLSLSGNVVSAINTTSAITTTANIVGGNVNTGGQLSATGNVSGGNVISAAAISAGGAISATGTVTGGNLATNGTIAAGSTVSATGNITGGNINTAGLVSATGNLTNGIANVLTGNAIVTTLVQGTTLSATANVIGANVQSGTLSLSGNVLSGLSMITNITTTANITGGNILSSGAISTSGTVTGATVSGSHTGSGAGLSSLNGSNISSGTVPSAVISGSYTGITGVGTIAAGTWNGSSISTTYTDAKVTSVAARTGAVTLAQADISGLTTASSPTFAGLTVSTGTVTLGNIVNGNGNGVGNIGSSTTYFNTGFLKATTAQYADLAENYAADADYAPGTVLVFGGNNEVTMSTADADVRVAGVVSTDPAHLMNSCLDAEYSIALALTGRVPAKVVGKVTKGDMMVSAPNGHAQACATPAMGTVIGKALQDFDGEAGVIEIVVGRL